MLTVTVKEIDKCKLYYFDGGKPAVKKPLSFIKEKINRKTNEINEVSHIQDNNKIWLKTYGLDGLMIETTINNILSVTE